MRVFYYIKLIWPILKFDNTFGRMNNFDTICPDCNGCCDTFEVLQQIDGLFLWYVCDSCGFETFRRLEDSE